MRRFALSLSLWGICAFSAHATPSDTTIVFPKKIINVQGNVYGEFVVLLANGALRKYDSNGHFLGRSKIKGKPKHVYFDAANRVVVLNAKAKKIILLSPNLSDREERALDISFGIVVSLMCPVGEREYWMYDKELSTLKKIDYKTREIKAEIELSANEEPIFIQEHQQFLFVQQTAAVTVYDALGHHIKTIDGIGAEPLYFIGEEMYYTQGDSIRRFNLYTGTIEAQVLLAPCNTLVMLPERNILVRDRSLVLRKH